MKDSHPQRIRLRVGVPNKPPFYAGGHPPGQHKPRHTRNYCTFRGTFARVATAPAPLRAKVTYELEKAGATKVRRHLLEPSPQQ